MNIALYFYVMSAIRILFVSASALFVFRTLFRSAGQLLSGVSMQNFDVFTSLFVCICVYLALHAKIFVIFALFIAFFRIFSALKNRSSSNDDELVIQYIDQILMNMRAGMSFESAHRLLNASEVWEKWFFRSQKSEISQTNGQEPEIVSLLRISHSNPSQTFKIFSTYRSSLRFQNRLQQKKNSMTLQARAQAGVSIGLFVALFFAQWFLQPDFKDYIQTSVGKLALTISILLLSGGVHWVFKLSRPTEFEL